MTTITLSPTRPSLSRSSRPASRTLSAPRRPRPGSRPRPASSAAAPRLTGRGRVLVLVAMLVLTFAAVSVGRIATQASQPGTGSTTHATQVWVVAPGETLWSIASRVEPTTDPRDTVQRIVELNGLGDSGVFAGERLIVPAHR